MSMSLDHVCVYHGNCADGFGAAWVVREKLNPLTHRIAFVPGFYQSEVDYKQFEKTHVIIVDFSYPRHVMLNISEVAASITWIDHHKTAIDNMKGWEAEAKCAIYGKQSLDRSGAYLTWEYFFPDKPMPKLIEHLDDRDRWQFKLPNTREIQAAVFSYPYDFNAWDWMMHDKEAIPDLLKEGEAIERKHFKDIRELLEVCERRLFIGGLAVPVANLPYIHSSDAGHILCEKYPSAPFAACYFYNKDNKAIFSLRSADWGTDVGQIAKIYGGGGHVHAAGFAVSALCVGLQKVITEEELKANDPRNNPEYKG